MKRKRHSSFEAPSKERRKKGCGGDEILDLWKEEWDIGRSVLEC